MVGKSSSSTSSGKMSANEKLLNILANTKANETIVAIDIEAGLDKLIGIGLVIFDVKNINSGFLDNAESKRFKLLHESQRNALSETSFWSDKQQLADDLVNDKYETEDEMYEEESKLIRNYLEDIIHNNTNVRFLVGTAQDIYYLARIKINLQMLVKFNRERVLILDMLYRGKISTFDRVIDESDNPYNVVRKKLPIVNSFFTHFKGKLGKLELHDCIDDCKMNITLYLAFMVGSSRFADSLKSMLNF